ncbi:hypothetical protein [Stenotrophomonas maltophilia]|uniref:hypothetical protein n=1 Tax=Stenotrophomonas maltophilia TaxID=40324 RepID=UPI0012FDD575|nr:hypothetical protein [Stenotrophomonas maltophilia]
MVRQLSFDFEGNGLAGLPSISPGAVLRACHKTITEWRKFDYLMRRSPAPRSLLEYLIEETGQGEEQCSAALEAADEAGLIFYMPGSTIIKIQPAGLYLLSLELVGEDQRRSLDALRLN